jgi:hypothetical protein
LPDKAVHLVIVTSARVLLGTPACRCRGRPASTRPRVTDSRARLGRARPWDGDLLDGEALRYNGRTRRSDAVPDGSLLSWANRRLSILRPNCRARARLASLAAGQEGALGDS